MNEKEILARRERIERNNRFDASGHGLDEIGLGALLLFLQLLLPLVPFVAPKFVTVFIALYLMAAGSVVWLLKRQLGEHFLHRVRGRITPTRSRFAYGVLLVTSMLAAFALLGRNGAMVPQESANAWGIFFTILFAFAAIQFKSVQYAAYMVLSTGLALFMIKSPSLNLFFTLLGGVIYLTGLIHLAIFIVAQQAVSRRTQ